MRSLRLMVEVYVPDYIEDHGEQDDAYIIKDVARLFEDRGLDVFLDWGAECTIVSTEVLP